MKVGKLYKVVRVWALPRGSDPSTGHMFWRDCGPVLYLGEDIIARDDGQQIVNHSVLVDGKRRIVDETFLRFFEPVDYKHVSSSMRF